MSIWYGVDPLAVYNPVMEDQFYGDGQHNGGVYFWGNLNPYIYCYQNPVKYIDPNGKQVDAVFNKSTGNLAIIPDVSKVNTRLPYKFVSAKSYSVLTASDKAKYNYGILVKGIFTGGHSENGIVTRDPDRPQQKPIPNGNYDILDNNADTKHTGWFRLDKKDNNPYNDKDDATGRDGFRFHLGTEGWGCVTCDVSQGDRNQEWSIITDALNSTKTESVPEKRGNQKWNPFSRLIKYGTLRVIGNDKVSTKKEGK